jgi:hypothetical protein
MMKIIYQVVVKFKIMLKFVSLLIVSSTLLTFKGTKASKQRVVTFL